MCLSTASSISIPRSQTHAFISSKRLQYDENMNQTRPEITWERLDAEKKFWKTWRKIYWKFTEKQNATATEFKDQAILYIYKEANCNRDCLHHCGIELLRDIRIKATWSSRPNLGTCRRMGTETRQELMDTSRTSKRSDLTVVDIQVIARIHPWW